MILFLIGYMGSGKSTLGRKLASSLKFDFLDTDAMIEKAYNATVSELFATKGEEWFREKEREALHSIGTKANFVVSTGGGLPCFFDNMDYMNNVGETIYLRIEPGILCSRLSNSKTERPLLKDKSEDELLQFVSSALSQRELFYLEAKHIIEGKNIKTDDIIIKIRTLYPNLGI